MPLHFIYYYFFLFFKDKEVCAYETRHFLGDRGNILLKENGI